jgi:hypothetical protein
MMAVEQPSSTVQRFGSRLLASGFWLAIINERQAASGQKPAPGHLKR